METKEEFRTDKNNTTMADSNRQNKVQKEEHKLAKAFIESIKEANIFEILANAVEYELKKIIERK